MKTDLRRWLAFGTGVAIEIREAELETTIVRVRPSSTAVVGSAAVTEFRTRPAAEWGNELSQFLRKLGFGHVAATVLLPRRDLTVRVVSMPGVSDSDLGGALALDIDSLHPFGDDEVCYSFARLGKTDSILVGITRREIVDRYLTMFAEAGIKVARFTFSAAVMYSAQRLFGNPGPQAYLATGPADSHGEAEFYGESEAKPVFSALLAAASEHAVTFALSELRLEQDAVVTSAASLLPAPAVFPPSHDPQSPDYVSNAFSYAAALISACPWLSLDLNLLPENLRKGSSRVRLIPTFALATILALLVGALAAQSKYEDSRYLGLVQTEIKKLEPRSRKLDSLDRQIAGTRVRTQSLDEFRKRTRLDIEALSEVTKIIAPPGWVNGLDLDRTSIQFGGEVDQAATLLKMLDNSPHFAQSQFTMPISRQGIGEAFRVKAVRENPATASAPVPIVTTPAPASPAVAPSSAPSAPAAQPRNPFAGAAK